MTQDIKRRWLDEPEAKRIDNYPDPEDVPESLKDRLAVELAVRAACPSCGVSHYYYSESSTQTVECQSNDCNEEFLLP